MKKRSLLLLLLLPFLYACNDKCEGIDCLSEDSFAFTIKSADSGADLLFGDDATLTPQDVEVYYMVNGSMEDAEVHVLQNYVSVHLEKGVKEYYVTALGETDTIRIDFTELASSDCCPATTRIDQKTVNGAPADSDSWVISLRR